MPWHAFDERHYVFERPAVVVAEDISRHHYSFFDESRRTMRLFMLHPNQKGVAPCLLQLLDRIDDLLDLTLCCVPSALLAARTDFNSASFPSCYAFKHVTIGL